MGICLLPKLQVIALLEVDFLQISLRYYIGPKSAWSEDFIAINLHAFLALVSNHCLWLYQRWVTQTMKAMLKQRGNRPLEPKVREVEFFPMEEVLYEEIEI